jgi:hypothetical protein
VPGHDGEAKRRCANIDAPTADPYHIKLIGEGVHRGKDLRSALWHSYREAFPEGEEQSRAAFDAKFSR